MAGAHENHPWPCPKGYDNGVCRRRGQHDLGRSAAVASPWRAPFTVTRQVLILDEPKLQPWTRPGFGSCTAAIARAKVMQMTVILMSHRPLGADGMPPISLMLEGGQMRALRSARRGAARPWWAGRRARPFSRGRRAQTAKEDVMTDQTWSSRGARPQRASGDRRVPWRSDRLVADGAVARCRACGRTVQVVSGGQVVQHAEWRPRVETRTSSVRNG